MTGPDPRLHRYPRPQFVRSQWMSLNGDWDFALDPEAKWQLPRHVAWGRRIVVPFSPETKASGIEDTSLFRACWYRREFEPYSPKRSDDRLHLHFGAVDYSATVWVNGALVGTHEGGFTPFDLDITDFLRSGGTQTVVVRAYDDPADLSKPRGKQDWQLEPHSIWYPRTTGIWQTVWLEWVPSTSLCKINWTPNVERWEVGFEARMDGPLRPGMRLNLKLKTETATLADDTYELLGQEFHRRIAFSDPGLDDYRNELLWTPSTPTLIDAEVTLLDADGQTLDQVTSYTALRSLGIQGDRFVLNGRPYFLRLVLDQGYWPETGLTAPHDEALQHDVELAKHMGFNGVRKHQKIEDPRYLYWADKLGLLVWEEMPSAYRFTQNSISRLTKEWIEAVERDRSHPCIVAWVPFNESWGVPDLPDSSAQRHYVQALYHYTKTLDPSRPVIGNDGWESVATDIIGIHDYDDQLERMAKRYGSDEVLSRLFKHERPGGRQLLVEAEHRGQPIMLTEFGGVAFSADHRHTWGYARSENVEEFIEQYSNLLRIVRSSPLIAGFCYTQFADTYQETNGLLYPDRTPKFSLEEMALATRGPRSVKDRQREWYWREQLMAFQRDSYRVPVEDRHARPEL